MRNSLILFSLAALVAACSEQDQQPTAPKATSSRAVGDVRPQVTNGIRPPDAQPVPQTGYTRVFTVTGSSQDVLGASGYQTRTVTAACPAGTQLLSGGYTITSGLRHLAIAASVPNANATNSWLVTGHWLGDLGDYSDHGTFAATVLCAQ
jgi:hypothetical protein